MINCSKINSERQAEKLLKKQLGKIYCPRCLKKHYIRKLPEGRYYCQKCRYKFSLKVLLGLKNSNLTLRQIIDLTYCFSQSFSLKVVCQTTEISLVSARFNYHRLRQLLPKTKGKLAGDIIADEAYVGRQKHDNQAIIAGVVDRSFKQIRLRIVPDREQPTLEQFILDYVETDSILTTDAWTSYYDIEWYGYSHRIENHQLNQLKLSVPIERVWALFKTLLRRTYHHIWKESLPEYVVEFEARFNHREIVSNPLNLLAYLLSPCSKSLT